MSARESQEATSSSLRAAATTTGFFERTRLFRGGAEIVLGEALAGHAGGLMFNALKVTATVRNYTLENVALDADSLILFQNGHAIPETAYFEPANAIRHLPVQADLTFVADNEDLIFGYNNAHRGYQHWLTQCVPAIDWSLRQQRTRDVRLILPRLEIWQEDILALLGYDRIPRLMPQAGLRYGLPSVEYSDFLTGATSFAICLSALDTAKRIASAVPSFPSDGRILYIDEVKPYYGTIRNEAAVIDLLHRHGVTIVERGRLSTAERINLIRNADVLIGPLGQGLADVLFCLPGALLWEWMPQHHQNASFNRLAQAAQVDYWGDVFETVTDPVTAGQWEIDLGLVARRLTNLSARTARRNAIDTTGVKPMPAAANHLGSRPVDELMLDFESLGDNCEFGLVQRQAGAEPLGLFRFNGFHVPFELRLGKLVAALERDFDGLGAPGTITVFPDGIPGQRELIVRESAYEFWYHTGIAEGDADPDVQCQKETTRLNFLRRKLLEDLKTGDKIWVWKSQATTHRDHIQPLLEVLRNRGPNTLLWAVEADDEHPAGTIEHLEPDLIKGYIPCFAPYAAVTNIHYDAWFEICWRTAELRYPVQPGPEPEAQLQGPSRPSTAMDFLARSQPGTLEPAPAGQPEATTVRQIWNWLRRR